MYLHLLGSQGAVFYFVFLRRLQKENNKSMEPVSPKRKTLSKWSTESPKEKTDKKMEPGIPKEKNNKNRELGDSQTEKQ